MANIDKNNLPRIRVSSGRFELFEQRWIPRKRSDPAAVVEDMHKVV